ncbi:hypothetical protein HPB52_008698 [Rhipicephalus sanguineus]|uniref:Endonuclease/exonuclease/phosphatase domain-containing protein n=1 Tax=Rhipicephalus sanguineus TaxID=34632 RepID=A0A9D4PVD9_RHISA|nr:hypothetical protein HPB52_008698 [Rhipicephalus sanguineus]
MEDRESWTVVQNRKLARPKPPTTPQPLTLLETIMLRPKAFNITQIPPYQFAYRLLNKPYKPAAPYSSPHRNASGKGTQKTQQSQEQNLPSLGSDNLKLTPQTRTQSATLPPTQPAVFWGYSKDSPKGKQLKKAMEDDGFTLLNTPDQYTRIGGAKQNNTSPDLTWVRHLPKGTHWDTWPDNIGSDHLPIVIAWVGIFSQAKEGSFIDWDNEVASARRSDPYE